MRINRLAALGLLAAAATAAHANLLTNGGFEAGTSGWTTAGLTCSGAGPNPSGTGCFGIDNDPGAHSGVNAMYLGTANVSGGLSQAIATSAGTTYMIDFWLANGAYRGISTPNDLLVQFGGQTVLSLTNIAAQGYIHYSFQVAANAGLSTLQFSGRQDPSWWVLDDVTVSAVPEPASLALVGLALAGVGLSTRRRQAPAVAI